MFRLMYMPSGDINPGKQSPEGIYIRLYLIAENIAVHPTLATMSTMSTMSLQVTLSIMSLQAILSTMPCVQPWQSCCAGNTGRHAAVGNIVAAILCTQHCQPSHAVNLVNHAVLATLTIIRLRAILSIMSLQATSATMP